MTAWTADGGAYFAVVGFKRDEERLSVDFATTDARLHLPALELRFFGGLSIDQTATILGVPKRTFERNWKATKAWLYAEVSGA